MTFLRRIFCHYCWKLAVGTDEYGRPACLTHVKPSVIPPRLRVISDAEVILPVSEIDRTFTGGNAILPAEAAHMSHHHDEHEELRLLREQIELAKSELVLLTEIRDELKPSPKLAFIKIAHGDSMSQGPVTLQVGQKTTAVVLGFDQFGAPFTIDFTANPVTWALDNATLDSSTPQPDQSDVVASLAAGTANLAASCAGFSDTEQVINTPAPPPPPVLSSIKIDFTKPV